MSFSNINIFAATQRQLQWAAARQKMINRNIAMANVPNAKAIDLVPLKVNISKGNFKLRGTDEDNTLKKGLLSGPFKTFSPEGEKQLSGNNIDPEDQLKLSNENALFNKQILTIRQKFSELFSMIV
jgi:flagellar basal body rod protein FlgB